MGRHSNYALIRPVFAGLLDEDEIYNSVMDDLGIKPDGDLQWMRYIARDVLSMIKWRDRDEADDERYRQSTDEVPARRPLA